MTEDEVIEPDWPTHCPTCGTELESEVIDAVVTNDWNEGSPMPVLAHDVCPNPTCHAREADGATPSGPGSGTVAP